ncbi:uncharacterized protein [Rutidosis leptorrhynchoides]|uniref:uncharacterized protein n=1 Tax=Rutidosis leptorrhynchoides TaxID=125765 RepID=UPI003A999EA4
MLNAEDSDLSRWFQRKLRTEYRTGKWDIFKSTAARWWFYDELSEEAVILTAIEKENGSIQFNNVRIMDPMWLRNLSTFDEAYAQIIKVVDHRKGAVFFLYGYGGTGKTFLWKTLSAALRSKGEIVLNVVSIGIAALLLFGGRTAHSRFHIPLHPTDESFCTISPSSKLGELIRRTKLLI